MDVFDRVTREAEGSPSGFLGWFLNWLELNQISASDFIPQTVINILDPGNSLQVKRVVVERDAMCSAWWDQVNQYNCN